MRDVETVSSFAGVIGAMFIMEMSIEVELDLIEAGVESDAGDLDDLLEDVFSDDDELARYDHQQHQRAIELVFQSKNRLAIFAVADVLLRQQRLTWSEVVAVIAESDQRVQALPQEHIS